jgi:gamma-glutamylcyclotransferase (GGCT)/AIG2-like uncharacterized protein YtfP
VLGEPSADDWPELLFVYGTLQPGASAWHLMEPHVVESEETHLPGTLFDTGQGYPALRPGAGLGVPGFVLRLKSPEEALPLLDEYEGEDYRRVRVVLPDGRIAWTYLWTAAVQGMSVLPNGWDVHQIR